MPLQVRVKEKAQGTFTIAPVGSLDANSYADLEKEVKAVLGQSPRVIIFDMEGLEYINSSGVGVVLNTKKRIIQQGGTMVMVNLQPQIRDVFDIIKALPAQEIFSSVQELDDYLTSIQHKNIQKRKHG